MATDVGVADEAVVTEPRGEGGKAAEAAGDDDHEVGGVGGVPG